MMPEQWALFSYIAEAQGKRPFGRVLDAGTGPRSIGWLRTLETESITAVTTDPLMERQVERRAGEWRPQDRIILGSWTDPELLSGEQFETVLADYLLGSVEAFTPYFQESLFARLRTVTAGRLYLTGVEPYAAVRPASEDGRLIWRIGRFRDACLLLLGKQPNREFPMHWVIEALGRSGFVVAETRKFPARYAAQFVNGQIDLVRPGLERMADRAAGEALIAHGEALRARALAQVESQGGLRHGFSYVIAADAA